jgi:hypothetical protein
MDLPLAADTFIATIRDELTISLARLDQRLLRNAYVRLDPRRKKTPIIVSPLEAQPEPKNLAALKTELGADGR